jgi:hypothetical protein
MSVEELLLERVRDDPGDPLSRNLVRVLCGPTVVSSAGFPVLSQDAWRLFRDRVPHILGMGSVVHGIVDAFEQIVEAERTDSKLSDAGHHFRQSLRVVRQVLRTAAITAPPDLWLMRHVLGSLVEVGLRDRILDGEVLEPSGDWSDGLDAEQLELDLMFLTVRGILVGNEASGFRLGPSASALRVLRAATPIEARSGHRTSALWSRLFREQDLDTEERGVLLALCRDPPVRASVAQEDWVPEPEEVELGYRLVPLVVGLCAAGRLPLLTAPTRPGQLAPTAPELADGAMKVLACAGLLTREEDGRSQPTPLGRRVFERGPGPFGIIEAYQPYMARSSQILREGRRAVHVHRAANIAASQRANRGTFQQANDAIDRFCADTGHPLRVFIEHALGHGEATRQRYARSGGVGIEYVGADLEDEAIDAAHAERDAGRLPDQMRFVRGCDIGAPADLIRKLGEMGVSTEGAFMVVGNGFHEVREQSDLRMIEVFRGYEDAGIVLVFTEETALSIADQLETAWNTYHAGFRYVHEKSGQGLRPSEPGPSESDAAELPMSWAQCASEAGYLVVRAYGSLGRTVYPHPTASGHNPSTSVNYFCVPGALAQRLGLGSEVA